MRNHVALADVYYRLSDEERGQGESSSIKNQRELVERYCAERGIIIVREFVDDGYSGGNFDRPGFRAMLEHLKTGEANTVVTKDLSRLGRDMSESSHYAERYFPEQGIRYLAPNDGFDSCGDNMMAPFQFAMNDVYLRDTSRKVKSVLDAKRKSGKYAACPPYGYKKAERTTDRLVPDQRTAPVVKRIFALAAAGSSTRAIALQLSAEGVLPPLKYRALYRDEFSEKGARRASDDWNYTTVKRILRNRVYLGHTLLGKSRKVSVKSKKKLPVPEEDWCFTPNTHEPLVTQAQFDLAEHFLSENTRANAANPAFRHSIFGGIACCAHCGAAMCSGGSVYKGQRERYWYLVCNNLSSRSRKRCAHGARIRYDDLAEIVRRELNQLIGFSDREIAAITEEAVRAAGGPAAGKTADEQAAQLQKQLAGVDRMIERLYRDHVAGYVSEEQLDHMIKKFSAETAELKERLALLKAGASAESRVRAAYDDFFALARKYAQIDVLDRAVLHAFVERIEVGEKILPDGQQAAGPRTPYRQSIRIVYRFIGEIAADPVRSIKKAASF
jgi:site-specific DNA recombinase